MALNSGLRYLLQGAENVVVMVEVIVAWFWDRVLSTRVFDLNPSLNNAEALEQTPALQALATVVLTLKDLTSYRSHKPGKRESSDCA